MFEGLRWDGPGRALRRDHGLRIQRQRVHPLAGDRRPGLGEEPARPAGAHRDELFGARAATGRPAPDPRDRPGAGHAAAGPSRAVARPAPALPDGVHARARARSCSRSTCCRAGTPSPRSRRSGPSPTASGRCCSSREIRTVAADRLWMSTELRRGLGRPALHLGAAARGGGGAARRRWRRALAPFGARPHWGKVFAAGAASIAPRYERHADFVGLVERLDPRGAFRNRVAGALRARRGRGAAGGLGSPGDRDGALRRDRARLQPRDLRGRRPRQRLQGRRRPGPRRAARARGQPHRRGRRLRGRRAAHRVLAAAQPRHVLPRDQDRRAHATAARARRSAGRSTGSASTGSTPSSCTTWSTSSSGTPR